MKTVIVSIDKNSIDSEHMGKAADIIRNGGLVAFPTETVYGLGANGLDAEASAKIYEAKGRPSDNPLILHIASIDMLKDIVSDIPANAKKLMDAFWPGPMTLIFNKNIQIPDTITGGLSTVAVRFPCHQVALELIRKSGVPIAAPSANISGKPSPTKGEHVVDDMDGRIDMIIDGGDCQDGLESTIIDVTGDVPMILRPGFITKEMIKQVVGQVEIDQGLLVKPTEDFKPKAPGMKYRHYAPKADFSMYRGETQAVVETIIQLAQTKEQEGFKVGIITSNQNANLYIEQLSKEIEVISLGDLEQPETIASKLFAALRDFDKSGTEYIYGETFSEDNVGLAIMNRLTKAAGYNIIDV